MHEVALHADEVRAEQQGAGDREAEQAVDADDRAPVLQVQGQRLADPPGVHEERGPADGEQPSAPGAAARAATVFGAEPEDEAVPEQADQHGQQRAATRPSQMRSAIRPTRRLPATSCAEPGRTRVITISAMARRKRTRAARSVGAARSGRSSDPGKRRAASSASLLGK